MRIPCYSAGANLTLPHSQALGAIIMSSKPLHVIFGTGPLGQAVMRELLTRENTQIRMVNRSGTRDGGIPAQVEVSASDAYTAAKVHEVTQGAAVVYQCAQPGYTEWVEKFPPLQQAILDGTAASGAKLIIGDNLYMYGAVEGKIHENLPYTATGHKGRTRAKMAQAILDAHAQGKVRAALARGSDFYGCGVLGSAMGDMVFANLLKGKPAQFIGNIDLPHTYTYIDDFGKAMVILGEHDAALGKAWHVPNAPTITTREFVNIITEEIGTGARIQVMPKILFHAIALVHPFLREIKEMLYEFEKPYIVDHSNFVKTFGNHATPHQEAIHQTIAWYRQYLGVKA
jgi:nucleoside-diphosphate-sugar epimerase